LVAGAGALGRFPDRLEGAQRTERGVLAASTIPESRIGTMNRDTSAAALRAPSPPFGMEERDGERRLGSGAESLIGRLPGAEVGANV
jgi:hypothetical protein